MPLQTKVEPFMKCMQQNVAVTDAECILCNDCKIVCPIGKFA